MRTRYQFKRTLTTSITQPLTREQLLHRLDLPPDAEVTVNDSDVRPWGSYQKAEDPGGRAE